MGDSLMIKKFTVRNYKGFKNPITLDLSQPRDYSFNSELIRNGIVNKAIIYGKNGSGKSNLGLALYDLTSHLTDKQRATSGVAENYLNLNNKSKVAEFMYEFLFDNEVLVYEYGKENLDDLVYERLVLNKKPIIEYHYNKDAPNQNFVSIPGLEQLNIDLPDNKLSIIKYIYRNTPTDESSPVTKIVRFAEGMLWFRCLLDVSLYIGFKTGNEY